MQLHLKVAGTGSYLPDEIIPTEFFANRTLNTYDEKGNLIKESSFKTEEIIKRTGIKERRRSETYEFPSDMGYKAAVEAIERSGITVDSLTGIILATVTEDSNFPSGACKIQRMLGARNCLAYDIANACASFPEALAQANARVLRRPGNYLVIASETLTKMTDYGTTDQQGNEIRAPDVNSTLFGDGAGATVLTPTEEPIGIFAEYSASDPFDGKECYIFRDEKRFLRMPKGKAVMKEAIREMTKAAKNIKSQIGWERADVYLPHQANIRIINGVAKELEDDGAKVFINVDKYGNMSGATCAIGLHECLEESVINPGSKVVIMSVGAGLANSAVGIQF